MIDGKYDNISFILYFDIFQYVACPDDEWCPDTCCQTYDASSWGGAWAAVFGYGWNGVYFKGDDINGIEDISVDVVSGTGIFSGFGTGTGARSYQNSTWGNIKSLYK
jgi:hypothetical protein